jgi:hypothetical protein
MKPQSLKFTFIIIVLGFPIIFLFGCKKGADPNAENAVNIIFLHHSTGMNIWKGNADESSKLNSLFWETNAVPMWFNEYNEAHNTNYIIEQRNFPKGKPYSWDNYPYDYYTIWVKNAGTEPYMEEPTLEILSKDYEVVVFKHCFPVSNILEGDSIGNVEDSKKTLSNYKAQYAALKSKIKQFPKTKFLLWTGAAQVESQNSIENAERAREFFHWVKNEWDTEGDNIFIWDFYELETEGGLFLKSEYAAGPDDSHPNANFSNQAAQLFCNRLVDVIENNGSQTSLTGE